MGVGRIEVEGIVDTEERKAEVLRALRGIPHLTTEIRTVAEGAAPVAEESGQRSGRLSHLQPPGRPFGLHAEAGDRRLVEEVLHRGQVCRPLERRPEHLRSGRDCQSVSRSSGASRTGPGSGVGSAPPGAMGALPEKRWVAHFSPAPHRADGGDHMVDLQNELEQLRAQLKPVLAMLGGDDSGKD